ncbi:hypothetical protein CHS0354_041332 [Potamilus streckersoni]|uniref:Uncharacterized protein n=1 Tax=Potamilus streckersoni TaxID=2493646 RepID=A0AAE0SEL0_9BIVA|nr:hypothetical protein CHS0354_041332 [Potamilus streckersoni]
MSDFMRKAMTIITAPIWVPVAAVGGVISGPIRGIKDAVENGEQSGGSDADKAAKTIGALPGSVVGRTVTGPFEAIGYIGKSMWGDEEEDEKEKK